MSIISSLFDWLKAIFKKIIDFVIDLIKKYWWIILIVAVIWFAPAIAGWLTSVGAPSWLTTAFTWLGTTVTPLLTSALTSAWTWGSGIASSGWAAFTGASVSTQLGILSGVGMLLAPDETVELVGDVAEFAGEVVYTVGSAVVSSSGLGSVLTVAGIGLGLWFLLSRNKDEKAPPEGDEPVEV